MGIFKLLYSNRGKAQLPAPPARLKRGPALKWGTVSYALAGWAPPSAARCIPQNRRGLMPGSAGSDLRIEQDGLGLPLLIEGAILSRHR